MRRRINTCFPQKHQAPWNVPKRIKKLVSKLLRKVQKKKAYRFIRNRVYQIDQFVELLVSSVVQGIVSKSEIAIFGSTEGKMYTRQNLEYRLDNFPVEMVRDLFQVTIDYCAHSTAEKAKVLPVPTSLARRYTDIIAIDGSTLEQMRMTVGVWKLKQQKLETCHSAKVTSGGHILVATELFGQNIIGANYHENALVNDTNFPKEVLEWTRPGTLSVMDRGFFKFGLFEEIIEAGADWIIPMKKQTVIRQQCEVRETEEYRESIVYIGVKPLCKYPLRLVEYKKYPNKEGEEEVRKLLTSVTDEKRLTAAEMMEVYQQRWTIEKVFKMTKRVLNMAYLWSSKANQIELQVLCTLIVYLLYNRTRIQIANEKKVPVGEISMEKVKQLIISFGKYLETRKGKK